MLFRIFLKSRNDRGLALDLWMKNRAPLSENIRKWPGGGGTLVGERGNHRTDKKHQRGSLERVKLEFWYEVSFFSSHFLLHHCIYIPWRLYRRHDQRVHGISAQQWLVLPLTMPRCAVYMCLCLRELVEEEQSSCPWIQDILCCVHVQWGDVPASAVLAIPCPLFLEVEIQINGKESKSLVYTEKTMRQSDCMWCLEYYCCLMFKKRVGCLFISVMSL